ncbi:MAG: DUF2147 domain-containing protein [Burkholderiales bacterium]|nr:DUF2147 domain-containing protein [Burkholderiales bacterium]
MTFAIRHAALGLAFVLASGLAAAQAVSPAGLWKTVDDKTNKDKSLVRIVESGGVYSGKVEKVVDPDAPKDAVCKECTDDRKDKPVVGMTIIRNMKASGDDKAVWEGGDILDPNNGKVYRLRLKLMDNGKNLEVRGFIGPFYRNQTWQRVE